MALSDEDKKQMVDAALHALTEENDEEKARRIAGIALGADETPKGKAPKGKNRG